MTQIFSFIKLNSFPKIWLLFGLIIFAIILFFWVEDVFYPSTNDSYLNANIIHISSQITAPVEKVYVTNDQNVTQGQLLATLDPRPFIIALEKAKAQYANATLTVKAEQAAVDAAKAQVSEAFAKYQVAKKNVPRILILAKEGKVSQAEGVKAQGDLDSANAFYQEAQQNLNQAEQKLGQSLATNPAILLAKANIEQAQLNLSYTEIRAPANGNLIHFELRPGTLVNAQTELFSIVENSTWWVDANFKETSMKRICLGQKATVYLDLYPGITFKGHVEGISIGSGAAFSLLPPENATGNWVKVTQRFTVKIGINNLLKNYPLRVGASAKVIIDTLG